MSEIIHTVLDYIEGLGYWGIFLGLMMEVIPNELLLAYAGYLVSNGQITFVGALICSVLGGTLAQIVLYWIGRYGGRPFIERYGKYLLIHSKHINVAEAWFHKYGTGMIFTARFIPIVRHAISIPGGMARMPLSRFSIYTALALIPYSILYISLGMTLKNNWGKIDEYAGPYIKPIILAAVVITVLYILFKVYRKKSEGAAGKTLNDEGKKNTIEKLKYIGKEYRVLHYRNIQGGGGIQEFDHIVIGPNGVFHIDSRYWNGDIKFTDEGVERSKEAYTEDPTSELHRHNFVMRELLKKSHPETDVVGLLCFTHPDCQLSGSSSGFNTMKLDRLIYAIKSYKPKNKLNSTQVREIEKVIKKNSNNVK